jgi:hypothetical protein
VIDPPDRRGRKLAGRPRLRSEHAARSARYRLVIKSVDMVLPCRRLPADGEKALAVVKERSYEGMVAKAPESP